MTVDPNPAFARTLVDEWARSGVTVASLAPGSRSAPLALALAGDPRITLEVFLDERSASFFALGAAKASGIPSVVLSTSGTAAAEFHPAVSEAAHSRTPMLVCTADRPPELRDTGAGQAIDQLGLFGSAARWFVEVGAPHAGTDGGRWWRSLACRALAETMGPPAGPVQLNLAFREPLIPGVEGALEMPAPPGRANGLPWTVSSTSRPPPASDEVDRLTSLVAANPRGIVTIGWGAGLKAEVVGEFCAASGWPVLADPLSGVRTGECAVSTYDALLRSTRVAEDMRPEVVLRLGAALTARSVSGWLDRVASHDVLVDPDGAWLDPARSAAVRLRSDGAGLLAAVTLRLATTPTSDRSIERLRWFDRWQRLETTARAAIDGLIDATDAPFEGRVARDLVACLPDGSTLVVGSSMPVRDVESFASPRSGLRFAANRGANGIDGFVSTVLGVAAASRSAADRGPVAALSGDLTFLHDVGGLLGASRRGLDATIVVVDNDGGGIFSFLPPARLPADTFELVFATPHGIDLMALAAAYGVQARRVASAGDLAGSVLDAIAIGGLQLIIVPSLRRDNRLRHSQVWMAVATAVETVD